jgi:putative endonuclease
MDRRILGNAAESRALEYLRERGLKFVCRNFLCKAGELDLVMLDGNTLAIVEVRSRKDRGYGNAAESIDWRKQRRIVRAAQYLLLKRSELRRLPVRFDVVTLDKAVPAEGTRIEWLRGAFDASCR